MKTKLVSELVAEDYPFVYSFAHGDGTVTLYYEGDELPVRPDTTERAVIIVSPRQFRQALTAAGLRPTVETFVGAQSQDVRDWYEYATEFENTHPMLVSMAAMLGKTQADIDALFALAATL